MEGEEIRRLLCFALLYFALLCFAFLCFTRDKAFVSKCYFGRRKNAILNVFASLTTYMLSVSVNRVYFFFFLWFDLILILIALFSSGVKFSDEPQPYGYMVRL